MPVLRRRQAVVRRPPARPGHSLRRGPRSGAGTRRAWARGLPGTLALLVLFAGAAWLAARLEPSSPPLSGRAVAVDGDSLRLAGERVRLRDIDAPELDQTCTDARGAEWPCGEVSRGSLAALLRSSLVTCLTSGRDTYGRLLATCRAGERDIGKHQVTSGLAVAYGGYQLEEFAARRAGEGIWAGSFMPPRQWRDQRRSDQAGPNALEQVWIWLRELTGATTLR